MHNFGQWLYLDFLTFANNLYEYNQIDKHCLCTSKRKHVWWIQACYKICNSIAVQITRCFLPYVLWIKCTQFIIIWFFGLFAATSSNHVYVNNLSIFYSEFKLSTRKQVNINGHHCFFSFSNFLLTLAYIQLHICLFLLTWILEASIT